LQNHEQKSRLYACHIGIGQNKGGLLLLSKSYKQAISVLRLSQKNKIDKIYYKDVGIYKILLSSGDINVLYEIYNDTLGSLADYDAANKTDYLVTLKCYLENDASVQTVAKLTFVHRNTINYKLKKIKEIMNCPINSVEDRLRILLAYKIKDIL
jgi:DNA-binding PucR family transcriptional regulator